LLGKQTVLKAQLLLHPVAVVEVAVVVVLMLHHSRKMGFLQVVLLVLQVVLPAFLQVVQMVHHAILQVVHQMVPQEILQVVLHLKGEAVLWNSGTVL
jgi:hypothetical protein